MTLSAAIAAAQRELDYAGLSGRVIDVQDTDWPGECRIVCEASSATPSLTVNGLIAVKLKQLRDATEP